MFLILGVQSGLGASFIVPSYHIQLNTHQLQVYYVLDAELGPLNQGQLDYRPGPLDYFMHSLSWTIFGHPFLYLDFLVPLVFLCPSSFFQHSVTHLISHQAFLTCSGAITLLLVIWRSYVLLCFVDGFTFSCVSISLYVLWRQAEGLKHCLFLCFSLINVLSLGQISELLHWNKVFTTKG